MNHHSDTASTYTSIRVLEVASVIAGPLAGLIFADLGADVIKIEREPGGDDSRSVPPHLDGESTLFASFNRGKRSVVLDLKNDADRESFLQLAADADVLIESFRPGVADRLGIGYSEISRRHPAIIYCAISGFGSGPSGAAVAGYDPLVQAASGLMSMTGTAGGPPVRVAASVVDLNTGMWAAMAIMAALARREKSGEGQFVEATLVHSGYMLLAHQISSMLATAEVPQATGSASPIVAPAEAFEASDGWIMITAGNDQLFRQLCVAIGADDLWSDERFERGIGRVANIIELRAHISRHVRTRTVEDLLEAFSREGVPAARVNTLDAALREPWVTERGLLKNPGEGTKEVSTVRIPIDSTRGDNTGRAPRLGEHTADVLGALDN